MVYELIQNSDTTSAVTDSLNNAVQKSQSLGEVTFNLSNITGDTIILSILGYSIVFMSLLFLFLTFTYLAKVINYKIKRNLKATGKYDESKSSEMSGEVSAAIAAALTLHFREVHDFENTVITIKKVQKRYSPWSSKIYGLREYPRK